MAKAKAIFIDGASFWNMMRILDVGRTDYRVLYEILVREVGKTDICYGKPFYTTTAPFKKRLDAFGFETALAESRTSQDDRMIGERISGLSADEVSEIILVSADLFDYLDCLRTKIAEGITVTLVATRTLDSLDRGGHSMLSRDVNEVMEKHGIAFVEIGQYANRLRIEAFSQRPKEAPRKNQTDKGMVAGHGHVRISFFLPEKSNALPFFIEAIGVLRERYPEVIFKMTNTDTGQES